MAERIALALINGKISEIPSSDTIRGSGGAENFSYHKIVENRTVKIEPNQHMITTSIEIEGFFDVEGGLVFL